MRRSSIACTILLVGLLFLCAGVTAAPPPQQLCGVCHGQFEDATGPGTLDIYLDDAGDAEWVERVPLDAAMADALTDDPDAREVLVAAAWADWTAVREGVSDRWSHDIVADELVVTYRVPNMATTGVRDAWIVRFFDTRATNERNRLNAAELRVHPPPGHAFTTKPRGATMHEDAAVWAGADRDGGDASLRGDIVMTYAPASDRTGVLVGYATRAVAIGPEIVRGTLLAGGIPTTVLGIGLFGVVRFRSWVARRTAIKPDSERYGGVLALGAVGVAGATMVAAYVFEDSGWLVITGGAVAYAVIVHPAFDVRRRWGPNVLLGLLLVWMAALVLAAGRLADWLPLLVAGPVLATLACAPLAVALRTDRSPVPAVLVILLAPLIGVASVMPTTTFGLVIVGGYTLLAAFGAVLVGGALLVWDQRESRQAAGGQPSNPRRAE